MEEVEISSPVIEEPVEIEIVSPAPPEDLVDVEVPSGPQLPEGIFSELVTPLVLWEKNFFDGVFYALCAALAVSVELHIYRFINQLSSDQDRAKNRAVGVASALLTLTMSVTLLAEKLNSLDEERRFYFGAGASLALLYCVLRYYTPLILRGFRDGQAAQAPPAGANNNQNQNQEAQ